MNRFLAEPLAARYKAESSTHRNEFERTTTQIPPSNAYYRQAADAAEASKLVILLLRLEYRNLTTIRLSPA